MNLINYQSIMIMCNRWIQDDKKAFVQTACVCVKTLRMTQLSMKMILEALETRCLLYLFEEEIKIFNEKNKTALNV